MNTLSMPGPCSTILRPLLNHVDVVAASWGLSRWSSSRGIAGGTTGTKVVRHLSIQLFLSLLGSSSTSLALAALSSRSLASSLLTSLTRSSSTLSSSARNGAARSSATRRHITVNTAILVRRVGSGSVRWLSNSVGQGPSWQLGCIEWVAPGARGKNGQPDRLALCIGSVKLSNGFLCILVLFVGDISQPL
jgi:hypothetical protein